MSDKITEHHRGRRAILYVRQSSQQQLMNNRESRRQQYAMRDRLLDLGFRDVEVIDEDLGKSAAGSIERSGFRRLVAEVSMGQVGAVAAREVSRFARNSREWQQLIEICRVVDTLLVDHDTVYAPRTSNDRLLLGLKGSLNEYELDLLRMRGLEAQRQKAQRGELIASVPVGYRIGDDGRLEKTPDARVRQVVELVFSKFFELGSARQVVIWMRESGIQTPANRNRRGQVVWKEARAGFVSRTLKNPTYAGAYVYGRTKLRTRIVDGQPRHTATRVPRDQWPVLLRDRHEAYISWEQFERAAQMLSKNQQRRGAIGAPRGGTALLGGLVWCRRCGHRLRVSYSSTPNASIARYTCDDDHGRSGGPRCISFSATDVDARLTEQVLSVVQPGAIEAARAAWGKDASEHDDAIAALELQLQQARYEAQRAERQYDAVEPENRTVVVELERRWNAALEAVHTVERRIAEATARRAEVSSPPDIKRYLDLASDLERVWAAPTTTLSLKKRIVRAVVEQVWADVDSERSEVVMVVHWKGGLHTELRVHKRRTGQHRNTTPTEVVEAVRVLARIMGDMQIARCLGRAGVRTPTGSHYSRALVASLRHGYGIEACSRQRDQGKWLTCEQAAALLEVDPKTLRRAAQRNEIAALHPLPNGPWVFARTDVVGSQEAERISNRARSYRQGKKPKAGPAPNQLTLTIPKT